MSGGGVEQESSDVSRIDGGHVAAKHGAPQSDHPASQHLGARGRDQLVNKGLGEPCLVSLG
jgi:hypothetical protein